MNSTPTPDRDSFLYTPYYCEENVWHLCQASALAKFERKAVFVTNAMRSCAFLNQRAAPSAEHMMFWDYHVVVLANTDGWQIWDLDTRLGMPVPVDDYVAQTFPQHPQTDPFEPLFRIVECDEFVETFSSDRSHMRNQSGQWLQPPPAWEPICRDGIWNLLDFLDTEPGGIGFLMDRAALLKRFGASP